jgi:hypothetical protein
MLWQGIILQNLASLYYMGSEFLKSAEGHDLPVTGRHPEVGARGTLYAAGRDCDSMSGQAPHSS